MYIHSDFYDSLPMKPTELAKQLDATLVEIEPFIVYAREEKQEITVNYFYEWLNYTLQRFTPQEVLDLTDLSVPFLVRLASDNRRNRKLYLVSLATIESLTKMISVEGVTN